MLKMLKLAPFGAEPDYSPKSCFPRNLFPSSRSADLASAGQEDSRGLQIQQHSGQRTWNRFPMNQTIALSSTQSGCRLSGRNVLDNPAPPF